MTIVRLALSALLILALTFGTLARAAQMPDCMGIAGATTMADHERAVDAANDGGGCDRPSLPMTKSVMTCHGAICMVPTLATEPQQLLPGPHASFAVPRNAIEWRDNGPAPETHPP